MLKALIAGLCTAFCACALAAPAAGGERMAPALARILADYDAFDRLADPIAAGQDGDREALARLPDVSPQAAAQRVEALGALQKRLAALKPARFGPEAQINHALLSDLIAARLADARFDEDRAPFQNDDGFFGLADYLGRTTPIRSPEDAEAWLKRLEALPDYYRAHIANMRRGLDTGFIQPRVVTVRALAAARGLAPDPSAPEKSGLYSPFLALPQSIAPQAQALLRERARRLIATAIAPAHGEVVRFLETEYLPKARAGTAARDLPDGEAYYARLVVRHTTTALTPDEIHALGHNEVARIRARMDEAIKASGFNGTFAEFVAMLRSDPRFYATTPEELLEKASRMAKRADDAMPGLFATLPRLPYGVRPVPEEIAEGYTTGRYWPGSPDLGVAGAYIVNTSRLDQRGLHELPALTLHEGVPGHHHQIALVQERKDLPRFRRDNFITAYVEGWGLYAEFLGEEMGFYRDPYELFGRLSYEMWRACRLVADTGLHWKRWTIAEARRCFDENSSLSPHNITTELERYVADPGQALAYKIGEMEIRDLRARASAALGPRFDLRRFHDVLLLDGPVPLELLEKRVLRWIEAEKARDR
jgi:uncharacterized protein (DUF885 family)